MTTTTNKVYTEPTVGGDVGTWGGELNADLVIIDNNMGGNQPITITVADVTLTASQAQNLAYTLTGALTGNRNLIFPAAQGGFFKINNNTTGTFTVTVKVSGGTGVIVKQGQQTAVWSDATNMYLDDSTPGRWINRQVFSTPGASTYTATLGTNFVFVRAWGGGGGGGGVPTTTSSQVASASGGGAGGYAEKRITSAFSGVTVTVGAAGTAGAAGLNNGGTGGTTSFGALLSATGGTGGNGGSAAGAGAGVGGAAGGAGSSGDVNGTGSASIGTAYFSLLFAGGGSGASSALGSGGQSSFALGSFTGSAGTGFASGGAGASNSPSAVGTRAGGAGTQGIVIVDEYL